MTQSRKANWPASATRTRWATPGTSTGLTYPIDMLVSFHYFGADKLMSEVVEGGKFRLVGDSGAYSALTKGAKIDIGAYADWVTQWRAHLCWAASLDVINDPVASLRNWNTLRHRYGVATVPSVHAGADRSWLDAYASEGVDFIGVGGLARKGQAVRSFRWTLDLFRYARERYPHIRFHLWGVLFRRLLGNLPAWSVDSSGTIGQAQRFGWLRAFDPDTGTRHQVSIHDPRAVRTLAPLLIRTTGIDPTTLNPRDNRNDDWRTLEAAVTQQYALWLQRRHAVPAPTIADGGHGPVGTRVHFVGGPEVTRSLAQLAGRAGPADVAAGPLSAAVRPSNGPDRPTPPDRPRSSTTATHSGRRDVGPAGPVPHPSGRRRPAGHSGTAPDR